MRKLTVLFLCVFILLSVSACSWWGEEAVTPPSLIPFAEPEGRSTATEKALPGLPVSAGEFNPVEKNNKLNLQLAYLVFEPLFTIGPDFEPQPALAKSYTTDGTTLLCKIDTSKSFSDGTPVTAKLVAESLIMTQNSEDSPFKARLQGLTITAPDESTLQIVSTEENTQLVKTLDMPIGLKKGALMLGTGAYSLSVRDEGKFLAAESITRTPREIRLFDCDQDTELFYQFDSGHLSAMLRAQEELSASKSFAGSDIAQIDTTRLYFIGVNDSRPFLQDSTARQGLSALINREDLCKRIFAQSALPAATVFHPKSALFAEMSQKGSTASDTELARTLFEEAGISDIDQDGRMEISQDGRAARKVTVTILVNKESKSRRQIADYIADKLDKAGITAKVAEVDGETYLQRISSMTYDLYIGEVRLPANFLPDKFNSYTGPYSSEFTNACAFYRQSDSRESLVTNADYLARTMLAEGKILPIAFARDSLIMKKDRFAEVGGGITDVYGVIFPFYQENTEAPEEE